MEKITQDILDVILDLNKILESLTDEEWKSPTAFKHWTPEEVVAHLLYFDRMTVYSVNFPEKFKDEAIYMFKTFAALPNSLDRAVAVKTRLETKDGTGIYITSDNKTISSRLINKVIENIVPKRQLEKTRLELDFKSNIPTGYGLKSSSAISTAVSMAC